MAQAQDRKIAAPAVNLETQHFWDAAAQGKLLIKKCTACGEPHFYRSEERRVGKECRL